MIFYYVRHGEPVYDPDSLTPLGERQAEAIGRRLALYGVDKVYTSTSNRAILTAKPTCDILGLRSEPLDFANESHVWRDLTYDTKDGRRWLFNHPETRLLSTDPQIKALGQKWYEHPAFADYDYKAGIERVRRESDEFFASLGYEHIPGTGRYKVLRDNKERVALFAHQGFGLAFLSCVLDIPYPEFSTHFDIGHSCLTVIEFRDEGGWTVPKICAMSSEAHLLSDGLTVPKNFGFKF